jgi:predicted HD phosphohydrolase
MTTKVIQQEHHRREVASLAYGCGAEAAWIACRGKHEGGTDGVSRTVE